MTKANAMTITLNSKMVELVQARLKSGKYHDETAVIEEGLEMLAMRDQSYEKWLLSEVVPACEAVVADPSSSLSIKETKALLNIEISKL